MQLKGAQVTKNIKNGHQTKPTNPNTNSA